MMTRPSERKPMTKAPKSVPLMSLRPPYNAAPSITPAAMAVNS